MGIDEGVVEFICVGGSGGEANVRVELRKKFPGLGGTIITHEGVATALREELSPSPKSGHNMFLKHMILKKLDDYFFRKGVYMFAHIPRPLGSISRKTEKSYEAYLYEWAFGSEGFIWERPDSNGNLNYVKLHDWNKFVANFAAAGIDMNIDIADPGDGKISKNIIHQHLEFIGDGLELSSLWKRIDFGSKSVNFNFNTLSKFLKDKKEELISILRNERYVLLLLSVKYLTKDMGMRDVEIGRLETLIGDYRCSSVRHFVSRGVSLSGPPLVEIMPPYDNSESESLM